MEGSCVLKREKYRTTERVSQENDVWYRSRSGSSAPREVEKWMRRMRRMRIETCHKKEEVRREEVERLRVKRAVVQPEKSSTG